MEEDLQTIRRVQDGETEAFRVLVERHERSVFAVIRAILGRADAAEDLAQDVFCAAYEHLGSFSARRGDFRTWLLAIARNRCLNERRRVRPVALAAAQASPADPPEAALARQETFERLDRALAALPVAQRTALVLADLAGLAHEDVAAIEGTRVGTVKSRISRARERLRERLGRDQGDET